MATTLLPQAPTSKNCSALLRFHDEVHLRQLFGFSLHMPYQVREVVDVGLAPSDESSLRALLLDVAQLVSVPGLAERILSTSECCVGLLEARCRALRRGPYPSSVFLDLFLFK